MTFGVSSALDLEMVITARDAATSVLEGIGSAIESVISTTADWQSTLTQVQTNTTMTAADIEQMRGVLLQMNAQSGAPLDQLATAFMKIDDIVGNVATATDIARVAQEGATGTYADQVQVATILSNAMHEYGLDTSDAATAAQRNADITANATQTMGQLIIGAQASGVQMQQFAEAMSQATAWGANLGVPLADIVAGMADLTRHGLDATQAGTQLRNEFTHIVDPAAAARAELANLSQVSGVNLTADFSAAGLQAKGLSGVLADLQAAEAKAGLSGAQASQETTLLIPAIRGALGAIIELGTGSSDYATILDKVNDKTLTAQVVQNDYQAVLGTFDQKIAIIQADWNQFLLDIGQPIIDSLTPYLNQLITFMNAHKTEITAFGTAIGTDVGGAVKGLIADIPVLVSNIGHAVDQISAFAASVGNFFDTAGTGIHEALFQIAEGIYDTIQGLNSGIDQSLKYLVDQINASPLAKLVGPINGPTPATADQIAAGRISFLGGLFPDIDPRTGIPYTGPNGYNMRGGVVGDTTTQYTPVNDFGQTDAQFNAALHAGGVGSGPPRVSGSGSGAGGASNYQDAQQALAAAQRALKDAQDRFAIDFNRFKDNLQAPGAQSILKADIARILTDEVPMLGYDALDRQKEQSDLLLQIAGSTKTATQHLAAISPLSGYRLPQQAGFQQSIISFASADVQAANQAETIRQYRAQITALTQQVAALQAQLAATEQQTLYGKQTAQATAATAQHAKRTADSVTKPGPSVPSALRANGAMVFGR